MGCTVKNANTDLSLEIRMKITNPVFSNIDPKDAPHYVDAQLDSCEIDGVEATVEQIELIPDNIKQELLYEQI
jgi:hypothetical protein